MRPNELGGQTLENEYELNAAAVALTASGEEDLAMRIVNSGTPEGEQGNIHPMFLGDSPEIVRPMGEEDTKVIMSALGKVAKGRLLVSSPIDELMAQSMVARYEGRQFIPKTNRLRKTLTKIGF